MDNYTDLPRGRHMTSSTISMSPIENLKWEIEKRITEYFILEKKWYSSNRSKKISFDESDSGRLADLIINICKDQSRHSKLIKQIFS